MSHSQKISPTCSCYLIWLASVILRLYIWLASLSSDVIRSASPLSGMMFDSLFINIIRALSLEFPMQFSWLGSITSCTCAVPSNKPLEYNLSYFMVTRIQTRWEATQRVVVPQLDRLAGKMALIQYLLVKSCIIWRSRS